MAGRHADLIVEPDTGSSERALVDRVILGRAVGDDGDEAAERMHLLREPRRAGNVGRKIGAHPALPLFVPELGATGIALALEQRIVEHGLVGIHDHDPAAAPVGASGAAAGS
jgi:hypothetical protein